MDPPQFSKLAKKLEKEVSNHPLFPRVAVLKKDDVYISHIHTFRPPYSRTTFAEEKFSAKVGGDVPNVGWPPTERRAGHPTEGFGIKLKTHVVKTLKNFCATPYAGYVTNPRLRTRERKIFTCV